MTIDEIYRELAKHMVEGLMVHSKLADYYGFLGFDGYQKCHEYHHLSEDLNYRKISDYYIHHYNKIIMDSKFNDPNIIPDSWYNYKRSDVSIETKKNSVENGIVQWVTWEQKTKKLYENMYYELIQLGELASAGMLMEFIKDVDDELAEAEQEWIEKSTMGYDINDIMMEQKEMKRKYKKKMKEIEL